ncbi:MAG: redox-regulated ATPase YchF [Dehalococcoidia bacterium]|nr:redox-regulated ATPase YchF [Dehalococcoidia bacterium]
MDIGIIGLAKSGKTTVFNALTRGHAETTAFGRSGLEPNVGVVKVPDPRMDQLAVLTKPRKFTPAEVRYTDIGGTPPSFGKGEGFAGVMLSALGRMDALLHVVRAFEDLAIPHPHGSVDPDRDLASVNLEIAFSDSALIERRLERLANTLKAARAGERDAGLREQELLQRLRHELDNEVPVREMTLDDDERAIIANYALLSAKPLLTMVNIGEAQLDRAAEIETDYAVRFRRPHTEVLAGCGKLEMELGLMEAAEAAEAAEFRAEMGVLESSLDRVIRASYSLLGFISFFTVGDDENRAWTITQGDVAQRAAGKIHTDLEKGFIRAEVVPWQRLLDAGGWAESRKAGHLRSEGKTYLVQDGDVMNILFSK